MASMRGPGALNKCPLWGAQGTWKGPQWGGPGRSFSFYKIWCPKCHQWGTLNPKPRETWNFRCRVMLKEPGTLKICGPSAPCSFTTNGPLISGTNFIFFPMMPTWKKRPKLGVSKSKMCTWVGVPFFEMPAPVGALFFEMPDILHYKTPSRYTRNLLQVLYKLGHWNVVTKGPYLLSISRMWPKCHRVPTRGPIKVPYK